MNLVTLKILFTCVFTLHSKMGFENAWTTFGSLRSKIYLLLLEETASLFPSKMMMFCKKIRKPVIWLAKQASARSIRFFWRSLTTSSYQNIYNAHAQTTKPIPINHWMKSYEWKLGLNMVLITNMKTWT